MKSISGKQSDPNKITMLEDIVIYTARFYSAEEEKTVPKPVMDEDNGSGSDDEDMRYTKEDF